MGLDEEVVGECGFWRERETSGFRDTKVFWVGEMRVFGGERLGGLGDKQARVSWRFLVLFGFVLVSLIFGALDVSAISRTRFSDFGTFNNTLLSGGNVSLIDYSQHLGLFYHFDNQSEYGEDDSIIYDFSGNGRNATIDGASINSTTAKYNSSITLNSGGILKNVTLDDYDISDGTSYTINFWAYPTGWSSGWFIGIGEKGVSTSFVGLKSDGTFEFDGTNNVCPTPHVLTLNQWTMITVSCEDATTDIARFYINGSLIGTDTSALCRGYTINDLGNAFSSPSYFLQGNIDELAVYEVALSNSAIAEIYENTYPRFLNSTGNYSQIYQTYNESLNVSTNQIVRWRSYLTGNSSINVYACVGENYLDCRIQSNGEKINLSDNASQVKIVAEFTADENNNTPYLEMLEPPKLSFYVDNQSSTCTDSNDLISAANSSNPFCTLEVADNYVESDSEMIVKYGAYCDGIGISNSGTEIYPIIIRAENISQKPFLNGTCSDESNGLGVNEYDYINFSGFEIFNFSSDAINIHQDSVGVNFDNMYSYENGYSQTTAAGDGISYHETGSGTNYNITAIDNYKSVIVDILQSVTYYYNIYGQNNRLYGIYFYGASAGGATNDDAYHEVHNATIEDSPGCFWSEVESHGYNITCNNISGEGVYFANRNNSLSSFDINTTNGTSIKILDTTSYWVNFSNGEFNENITVINSTNVLLNNVTYNQSLENVDENSMLTRKWYLDISTNVADTNITITNSTGNNIYSNLTSSSIPRQTLTSYVNGGGTTIYYSNYTIIASASGYDSQSQVINLTNNTEINFVLSETATEETTPSGSSGGAPTYKISSQNLVEGYSKRVYRNSRLSFENGGEAHSLKVNSINYSGSSVNVTVSSEPQTKLLFVGDEWKVDLDNDSSYDLLVRLDGVSYGAAEIFVLGIDERYGFEEVVDDGVENVVEEVVDGENFVWVYVGVLGLVVLLVVGFFVFRFWKKGFKRKSGRRNGGKKK